MLPLDNGRVGLGRTMHQYNTNHQQRKGKKMTTIKAKQEHVALLQQYGADETLLRCARKQPDMATWWGHCQYPEDRAWWIRRVSKHGGAQHRRLILALCDIVWETWPDTVHRSIDVIEAWAKGEDGITLADVRRRAYTRYGAICDAARDVSKSEYAAAGAVEDASEADPILRKYFPIPPKIEVAP